MTAERKRAAAPVRAATGAAARGLPYRTTACGRYREELAEKLRHEPTDDELYSHLMYPQVFADFAKHQREYGDVSVLPTPAFFYGLSPGEEITVDIEEGKTLIIRLMSVGTPDEDGRRALSYELNGMAREAFIIDKSVAPKAKTRPKADLGDPLQVAAPIPGLIAALYTSVGAKVAKGDKLFTMEAMKMQTTVFAPVDGVVAELHAAVGDTVEAKDLDRSARASRGLTSAGAIAARQQLGVRRPGAPHAPEVHAVPPASIPTSHGQRRRGSPRSTRSMCRRVLSVPDPRRGTRRSASSAMFRRLATVAPDRGATNATQELVRGRRRAPVVLFVPERFDGIETGGLEGGVHPEEDADRGREAEANGKRPPRERDREAGGEMDDEADQAAERRLRAGRRARSGTPPRAGTATGCRGASLRAPCGRRSPACAP